MASSYLTPHHRSSHLTNEIYKTVKVNFRHPENPSYQPENVWQRRQNKLVLERPEDYWKAHFIRRGDNFKRGFYSVNTESYKCMGGNVILDTHDLVYDNLKCIDKEKVIQSRKEAEVKPEVYTPIIQQADGDDLEGDAIVSTDNGRAGYQRIIDYLKIVAERRAVVRGGLPYEEHIHRVQQRLTEAEVKPVDSMVLMSTSNIELEGAMNQERSTTSVTVTPCDIQSDSPDFIENDKSRDLAARKESYAGNDPSRSSVNLRPHTTVSEKLDRLKKDNIEYIQSIIDVIVILHNMKAKYLKSKIPLPAPLIRSLKRPQSVNRKSKFIKSNRYNNKRQSTETLLSNDYSNMMLNDRRPDSPSNPPKSTRIMPTPTTFGLFSGRKFSKVAQAEEMRMETWEDLIHLDNKDKLTHNQNDAAMHLHITAEMAMRSLKWSKVAKESHVVLEDKPKHTIWQVIAMEKTSGDSFQEKKKPNTGKDIAMVTHRARRDFEKLKANLQRTCEAEVEQHDRQTLQYFRHKFNSFNGLKMNSIFEKHCKRMRDTSSLIPISTAKKEIIEVLEVPPSKWFEELQIKIFSTTDAKDADVNGALMQLGRFSQMGVRTVPHCRARLCLLVMSMPAYDLCKISMQLAIRFVLEEILTGQAEEFYHWLHLRKLPLVLIK
ncbi:hypothetical protein SNE40_004501 [Patella caerulea]|uniref:Uncharacterized protein n=1 Tax=Patella caerulea TaxID=87958 RepID=A0AAN8KBZ4_PATCE